VANKPLIDLLVEEGVDVDVLSARKHHRPESSCGGDVAAMRLPPGNVPAAVRWPIPAWCSRSRRPPQLNKKTN
jgi:hypothetical protein